MSASARSFGEAGGGRVAELSQQFGAGGVQQVIVGEPLGELIDLGQGGVRAGDMAEGDGVIQPDHRRPVVQQQHVIEGHDLQPVGVRPGRRARMAAGDGGLQLEPTRPAQRRGGGQIPVGPADRHLVPRDAILILQQDQLLLVVERAAVRDQRKVNRESNPQASGWSGRARATSSASQIASSVISRPAGDGSR